MRRDRILALAFALLVLTGSNNASASDVDQDTTSPTTSDSYPAALLEQCPFKRWTPINTVKEFYRITYDPVEEPWPVPYTPDLPRSYWQSMYHYLLEPYGVVIRFGADLQMLELGVRRPFLGTIGRVAIGATKEDVRRIRGETSSVIANSRDPAFLRLQRDLRRKVLQQLPDPASRSEIIRTVKEIGLANQFPIELMNYLTMLPDPVRKDAVREVLEHVNILDEASLKYTTDWTYSGGSGSTYITLHFAPDDTVQAIFASSCDVD